MGDMADDFLNDVIDAECRQIDLENTPRDLWDEDDCEFMQDRHPSVLPRPLSKPKRKRKE